MNALGATVTRDRTRTAAELAPPLGFALIAAIVAYGLLAEAAGAELGTASPPMLYRLRPELAPAALGVAALFAAAVALAPRLRSPRCPPLAFGAAALALGLTLRLALALARGGGTDSWFTVFRLGDVEAASEYLPALPALDFGLHAFLDRFAELGTSLPVHVVGHPPGLLSAMHLLGIDSAAGLATLTIGVGALSIPLVYLISRPLLDENRARMATLIYVFAPAAVMHGATSADALFATFALLAAIPLLACGRLRHAGPIALALASFFSYANLAIGAWATLVRALRGDLRRAVTQALACASALVAFYVALYALSGFDPLGTLRAAESVYREGVASGRPYAFWVLGSPAAFLIAGGLPITWYALRALGARREAAVALFAILAVAAVLGFTKAETERIYLFLVPLLCVAAASELPERHLRPVLGLLAAQGLLVEILFHTVW